MTPKRKPYNPGLSEKAWDKLHEKVVHWNIKYGDQLREKAEQRESKRVAK